MKIKNLASTKKSFKFSLITSIVFSAFIIKAKGKTTSPKQLTADEPSKKILLNLIFPQVKGGQFKEGSLAFNNLNLKYK